ncbi:MAG: hypothetical protein WBQ60_07890 [Asticcacaulis sp.]
MKRLEMVHQGAQQLTVAENAVETALVEVSKLMSNLGEMRLASNLSPVLGQDAMQSLAESINLLSTARGKMVAAHNQLDGVKTKIGCGPIAVGVLDKGDANHIPLTGIVREKTAA